MTNQNKIRIVVDEDEAIVQKLDALAEAEGLSRSDMLRRAIRRLLFSSAVPTSGTVPEPTEPIAA